VRYLILSDIHANIDALEAVLAAAPPWDRALVLGDLVGYGGAPNAVIDRVRGLDPMAVIRGNHDKAACGLDDGSNFNQVARFAAAWTYQQLGPEYREYLRQLPQGPTEIDEQLEICHGAPFDEDHYIFDAMDAHRSLQTATRPVCLFGHTHLPVVFRAVDGEVEGAIGLPGTSARLGPERAMLNPGSVGQPRDGLRDAAYAVLDLEPDASTFEFRRVSYDIDRTQRLMREAELPVRLVERLAYGR